MDDDFISQKIVDYLGGDLPQEEAEDFEAFMKADQELREKVALVRMVIESIKACAFRKMLKKIHQEQFAALEKICNNPIRCRNNYI